MREILFRGKRLEIGAFATETPKEWVYGGLVREAINTYIFDFTRARKMVMVDPNTVGQYTGLTDKNGVKIFEGDIILGNCSGRGKECFEVWWSSGKCGFAAGRGVRMRPNMNPGTVKNYEVIGNIHDNPELLEGGAQA